MRESDHDALIKLMTSSEERWDAHDKRSESQWGEIKESTTAIFKRLETLACPTHQEKIKNLRWSVNWLWKIVIGGPVGAIIVVFAVFLVRFALKSMG